jgi:hypothetical protein
MHRNDESSFIGSYKDFDGIVDAFSMNLMAYS